MARKSWLAEVIDHEIESHWDDARQIVGRLRDDNPSADPDLLVNSVIDDKARVAAFVGIGTGALQAVPAVGQALSIGLVIPEALYLAKVQVDIALVISLVYRAQLTPDEVKGVILSCLVLALGADFVKKEVGAIAVRITQNLVEKAIARMGERELIRLLSQIGIEATKAGILAKVPVVGIPINAVLNYGQIQAFGWTVKKFCSPSFVMCGGCGEQTGKLNRFCPRCGFAFAAVQASEAARPRGLEEVGEPM